MQEGKISVQLWLWSLVEMLQMAINFCTYKSTISVSEKNHWDIYWNSEDVFLLALSGIDTNLWENEWMQEWNVMVLGLENIVLTTEQLLTSWRKQNNIRYLLVNHRFSTLRFALASLWQAQYFPRRACYHINMQRGP